MDFQTMITEMFKLSPIVGLMLWILNVVWRYVHQKDAEMTLMRTADNIRNMDIMERMIRISAESNTSNMHLAGCIDKLSDAIDVNQAMVMRELSEIKNPNVTVRELPTRQPRPARA